MCPTKTGDDSLAPTLLVSMPQLLDPNFAKTVVLLCEHNAQGAFGLVLNRPSESSAADAVHLTPPPARDSGLHLWYGGPVEPQRGWILMAEEPTEADAVEVVEGLYLSTSPAVLRRLIETGPERARVLTGYAGWGAGQLDAELAASAWLTAAVDLDLVFETPADLMWEAAIRRLGADPALLQMGHGVH
jgi:putative transcriptional regulator